MAITVNPIVMASVPTDGVIWAVSLYSTDLEGGETIKTAVSGKSHYLTKLRIRCSTTTVISVGDRVADTGALTTTLLGPATYTLASTLESQFDILDRPSPEFALKFQSGYGIGIIAVGVANVWIWAEGKTA
jgi:hypothetical protein